MEAYAKYKERRRQLGRLADLSSRLATSAIRGRRGPWQLMMGAQVFTKVALHALSLCRIAPDLGDESATWRFADPSSLAAVARALFEAYLVFFYMVGDEPSAGELAFRETLWHYHAEVNALRGMRALNPTGREVQEVEEVVRQRRESLVVHPEFRALEKPLKKLVLNGRKAVIPTVAELAQQAGIAKGTFVSTYALLSSYVHTEPFCLRQLMAAQLGIPEGVVEGCTLVISQALGSLSLAISDFVQTYEPDPNLLDPEDCHWVNNWVAVVTYAGNEGGAESA